jgi:hypothetical protein
VLVAHHTEPISKQRAPPPKDLLSISGDSAIRRSEYKRFDENHLIPGIAMRILTEDRG